MAKVKYGTDIKTKQDLQNLITALIFRSETYTLSKIVQLTQHFNQGSEVQLSQRELTKMVEETLDLFQRHDLVSCTNGLYRTKEPIISQKIKLNGRRDVTRKPIINRPAKVLYFKEKQIKRSPWFEDIEPRKDDRTK